MLLLLDILCYYIIYCITNQLVIIIVMHLPFQNNIILINFQKTHS